MFQKDFGELIEHILTRHRTKRQLNCRNGFFDPTLNRCQCYGNNQWTGTLCDIGKIRFYLAFDRL